MASPLTRRTMLVAGAAFSLVGVTAAHGRSDMAAAPVLGTNGTQFIEIQPHRAVAQVSLQRLNGSPAKIDLSRRPVLVNFFATWCPPCRRELPILLDLHRQRRAKLDVLAVSIDEGEPRAISRFIDDLGLRDLPVFLNKRPGQGLAQDAAGQFDILGVPITYVIAPPGQILGYVTGTIDWLSPEAERFLAFVAS